MIPPAYCQYSLGSLESLDRIRTTAPSGSYHQRQHADSPTAQRICLFRSEPCRSRGRNSDRGKVFACLPVANHAMQHGNIGPAFPCFDRSSTIFTQPSGLGELSGSGTASAKHSINFCHNLKNKNGPLNGPFFIRLHPI